MLFLTATVHGSTPLLWTETQATPVLTTSEWRRSPAAGKVLTINIEALWRGEQVDIQSPSGEVLRTTKPQLTPHANGTTSFIAHFTDQNGVLQLVMNRHNRIHGYFQDGLSTYVIVPLHSGQHLLKKTSDQVFPNCDILDLPLNDEKNTPERGSFRSGDPEQTSQFDVLIVVSETLAAEQKDLEGFIQLAFDVTNETFANSAVNARVNLVHTMMVDYPDPNTSSQIWRDLSFGSLTGVHTVRNEVGADLVSIWLTDIGGSCGQAPVNLRNDPSRGLNIVAGPCVIDNLSFPHELGHNLGAVHDRNNTESSGFFPYSYGYQKNGHFRTVMAYFNGCSCPRVAHFSNPDIRYEDQPTGIPADQSDSADNALTFNQTRTAVSQFREPTCPGATITSQPQDTAFCPGGSRELRITAEGENLQYQWYRHQVAIDGATNAALVLDNLDPEDAGRYHCQVTNACTTAPSAYAVVSIFVAGDLWPAWPTNNVLDILASYPEDCF